MLADKTLVVRAAHHFHRRAAGHAPLEPPELGQVLPIEDRLARPLGHGLTLGELKLQIHPAPIHGERQPRQPVEEILGHHDVTHMGQLVGLAGGEPLEGGGDMRQTPMPHRGGPRTEEAIGKQPRPGGVLEAHELDAAAKLREHGLLLATLAAFTQRQQVDRVVPPQGAQQMERPLVGAAVHRKRNIGIDNQEAHGQLNRCQRSS